MKIIHPHELPGYDSQLEQARQEQFQILMSTKNKAEQLRAARNHAELTELRRPELVAALEMLLGLVINDG